METTSENTENTLPENSPAESDTLPANRPAVDSGAAADVLTPFEARVLGCLIEKEFTTPEYYPLTLNALVNAANQKNNRDPVMALTSRDVEIAAEGLRHRRMLTLFSGADARAIKHKQTLENVHPISAEERALICELLLRGPQTAGELRGRCERMVPFESIAMVEEALAALAGRAVPLVTKLARQPGRKEARWAQLLTGIPEMGTTETTPVVASTPSLPSDAEARIATLEAEVEKLRSQMDELQKALGVGQ